MSCSHEHHHDDDHLAPPNTNEAQTLYPYIDVANVTALNVTNIAAAGGIVRPYQDRLLDDPVLESDVDEEIIIHIPFTGEVRLHSVLLRSEGDESSPAEVHLYKDQPQLDFEQAESSKPQQILPYPANIGLGSSTADGNDGIVQFAVNRPKFTSMTSLTLYIPKNYGAEQTRLTYIGLRGDFSKLTKAPVIAQYEAAANPADHKTATENLEKNSHQLG